MTKVGQRYRYKSSSPVYSFVAEITKVLTEDAYFNVKVVSCGPQSAITVGQTFEQQPIGNWEYLPGQDAP